MKRILLLGDDKPLARFYYLAFLRCPGIAHAYRSGTMARYTCSDDDYPDLLAIAETLDLHHETIATENKYQHIKRIVEETYPPKQPFKLAAIVEETGYTYAICAQYMARLVMHGYVESHGRTMGHYYCRPDEPQEPPDEKRSES